MSTLNSEFTSDSSKFFYHQDNMEHLRKGKVPGPIVCHVMPCDVCDRTCSFCSVLTREGNSLTLHQIEVYLDQLIPLGLKAVIISGGGNPILFRDKTTGKGFNELVDLIHNKGLEIGLITNGLKMKKYPCGRTSWITVKPETLDKLLWVRISMAGLDHPDLKVDVPDVDKSKTTLGFSYVYHDSYEEPLEPNHGKVSTISDLITPLTINKKDPRITYGKDRLPWLTTEIKKYVDKYEPKYVRLLPNCLEPHLINNRCDDLRKMADEIDPLVCFVQSKPPKAPEACYLGYLHPVLSTNGKVYPCDSCTLNHAAGHKFADPWVIAEWDTIGELYTQPLHSLVESKKLCSGCVFESANALLGRVANGMETPVPLTIHVHKNFI